MNFKKPVTTEYFYSANIENPIKIVQISDLHCCELGKDNATLLNTVAMVCPDIIVITGDLINKRDPDIHSAEAFLSKLVKIAPCFYSLGNHELRFRKNFRDKFNYYIKFLEKNGITLLDDKSLSISVNGTEVEICGFSASEEVYKKFHKIVLPDNIPEPVTKAPVKLLLAHNPELAKAYEKTGWNIIFSGHLHGGIVRLPFVGGIISPRYKLFPKYSGGFYKLANGSRLLVSRGLGMHTIKIRLWNPPELTVLNID